MMRDKNTFRTLFFLALPTMLEHLLSTLMQYVDTAMVGRLGADATAAVSTTTTITWLTGSLCASVAVAVLTMVATASGAKQFDRVRKVAANALILSAVTGAVISLISIVLSPFIPVWMGIDASVQKMASLYFLIISIPGVFRSFCIVLGAAVRATHDTKNPMFISLSGNGLNVLLNILLIYTLHLGVTGAALATAISETVSGIWMLILFLRNRQLRFGLSDCRPDKAVLKESVRIGMPVLATSFTSCMGYVVFAGMITALGKVVFAAHSIAVTAEELFYLPGYGLRSATQTLIGNSIGEEDEGKFRSVCRTSIVFTVFMMLISGLLLFCFAYPLMKIFTSSDEAAVIGARVLKLVALSEPLFGLQIVLEGIFYGVGKTRLPFFINTFSMWAVRILFTYLCIHVWGLDLIAVWVCMIMDNACKAVVSAIAAPGTFRGFFKNRKTAIK